MADRYRIGYYCPRGKGHLELLGAKDYSPDCGSRGWDVYLDGAEPGEEGLPEGDWVPTPPPSSAVLVAILAEHYPRLLFEILAARRLYARVEVAAYCPGVEPGDPADPSSPLGQAVARWDGNHPTLLALAQELARWTQAQPAQAYGREEMVALFAAREPRGQPAQEAGAVAAAEAQEWEASQP